MNEQVRKFPMEPLRGLSRPWGFVILLALPAVHQVAIFPSLSYFFATFILATAIYVSLRWRGVAFYTALRSWALPPFILFLAYLPSQDDVLGVVSVCVVLVYFGTALISRGVDIELMRHEIRLRCFPCGWQLAYSNIESVEEPTTSRPFVELILKQPERDFLNSWTGKVRSRRFPVSEANAPEVVRLIRARIPRSESRSRSF